MDNLMFERVKQNDEFFQVKVTAVSTLASSTMYVNVVPEQITELAEVFSSFSSKVGDEAFWDISKRGSRYPPYLSFRVFSIDMIGHIRIEVYMEIDDEGYLERHNSCFFVNTGIKFLHAFGKRLEAINEPIVGMQVALHSKHPFR